MAVMGDRTRPPRSARKADPGLAQSRRAQGLQPGNMMELEADVGKARHKTQSPADTPVTTSRVFV